MSSSMSAVVKLQSICLGHRFFPILTVTISPTRENHIIQSKNLETRTKHDSGTMKEVFALISS